ncbi:MAG: hypothetical protein ACRDOV_15980, partial [Streptomyces sp.]
AGITLAAPVCSPQAARMLEPEADEILCLQRPAAFGSVGFWYQNFNQLTDEEVLDILREAGGRTRTTGSPGGRA